MSQRVTAAHVGVVALVARRVDVDAAEHVVAVRREDGVGEAGPRLEVAPVALEVAQVLRQRHALDRRPVEPGEARRGADVRDARRPRRVVGRVVLGPQRDEAEAWRRAARRDGEAVRDEGQRQPRAPTASSVRAGSAARRAPLPPSSCSTAPSALSPRRGTVVGPLDGRAPRKS